MTTKERVILVDIDGTIALKGERHPHDFTRVLEDSLNEKLYRVLLALSNYNPDLKLAFISGRMNSCRNDTLKWINHNCKDLLDKTIGLFMREDNDFRDDQIIKLELYQKMIEPYYDAYLIFDDRNRVVDMWRSQGLTCFQVAEGNF